MLWLSRPPILRWIGAVALVAVAMWSQFGPVPTVDVPFLITDVSAGSRIRAADVEMRSLPDVGLIPASVGGFAATDLNAGDPLLPSMTEELQVPRGWFLIEAPLPEGANPGSPGTAVVLAATDGTATATFPIRVASSTSSDAFAESSGTIAVPADWVAQGAAAAAAGHLVVAIEAGE